LTNSSSFFKFYFDIVSQFGNPITSEQEMKQRQTSYLMNNNDRRDYISSNFNNQSIQRNDNSYNIIQEQEQKLRLIISKKKIH